MRANPFDVIVSGAGPNGLMVASELALAGVRPVVLDALVEPSAEPKANGLVGQVIRLLDMRGLYHELGGPPGPPQPIPAWAFSGIPIPLAGLTDNPMYSLLISQPQLVRRLQKWVADLGVGIRWGHELIGLAQHGGGVTVTVAGPNGTYELAARYLIGADGGRSLIRKTLGIDFPGTTTAMTSRIAHVSLPDDLRSDDGGLDVPGLGGIPPGHNRLERGGLIFAELEAGRPIIATLEFGGDSAPDDSPLTLQELRDSLRRVLGVDLPIEAPRGNGPHALRRIDGQNTRQAERYRDGNVFLVGDAAHVHSAMGGPGLNLGLQDAVNLGWKLAAAVNGWAPAELLDTYHGERHPAGQRVMIQSMSQTALMAPGPEVAALRLLLGELLQNPATATQLAHLLAGSDARYDVGDDHPMSGRLAPDLMLDTGQRVAELMRTPRPVLLDLAGGVFADSARDWAQRVDAATASSPDAAAAAILIRPDGYVAWAADDDPGDVDRLRGALTRWFGAAGSC